MRAQIPRILIGDDHKLVADACRNLLEPDFEVVGVVTDGHSLVEAAAALRPNVVILDIFMPRLNGLDAGEQIKRANSATRLLYLTMDPTPDIAMEAFRRGASGYLTKGCSADELTSAVRQVLCGQYYLASAITQSAVASMLVAHATGSPGEKRMTERQTEILQLHAEGKTMKEIAFLLGVQPGTVAFHKYRIMDVLGISTNAGLIQYAVEHHMIPRDIPCYRGPSD